MLSKGHVFFQPEEDGDDSAFENLSNNNDFVDVTLACEDGQHWEAHNVILAGQVLFH